MADVRQAVYYRLANTSAVTALISTRIYPLVMPQQPTMPAVVYQVVDNVREQVHRGQTTGSRARVQVTCWGDTQASVAAVKEQVRLALIGASGTIASVVINGVICEGEVDGYEPDTSRHFTALDFMVWHREAAS